MATSVDKFKRKALFKSEVGIEQSASIASALDVTGRVGMGSASVTGNLTVGGTLIPAAIDASAIDVDFEDIEAKGSASVASVVAAACGAFGSASITRSASIASVLNVGGSAAFTGGITSVSSLNVTGSASVASAISAASGLFNSASVTDSASVGSALDVGNRVNIRGGLKVASSNSEGVSITEILAGSINVTTPPFTGTTTGSIASVTGTIAGLTESHTLLATLVGASKMSPCTTFVGACVGAANTGNFYFAYIAASGGEAVSAVSDVPVSYLALKI